MGRNVVSWVGACTAAVLALALGLWLFSESDRQIHEIVVVVIAMVAGSLIAPSVSSLNRLTLAVSVAAAVPLIFVRGDGVDLAGVVASYLVGSLLIALLEMVRTGLVAASAGHAARRFVGYSTFAILYVLIRNAVGGSLGDSGWESFIPFMAAGTGWISVELALWSVSSSTEPRLSVRYVALSGFKDINVFISLIATGGLFGLMYEGLAWWALPVALLPYSFAHVAFRRFHETKSTYRQTIRALAQIPEAASLNLRGHSDRTSALAVAMAKDLGLSPEEVEDVEFAALMHDIGHITLNDPTVIEHGWTDDDLARWGAEIIAGAPSLDRVSGYVRRQYEPFRKPGEDSDPTVPRVARIVKIASAYDTHRMGRGLSQLEALEELHKGAAYEYDPEVVASLRRVLEKSRPVNA